MTLQAWEIQKASQSFENRTRGGSTQKEAGIRLWNKKKRTKVEIQREQIR
jgi:hypothetical protein